MKEKKENAEKVIDPAHRHYTELHRQVKKLKAFEIRKIVRKLKKLKAEAGVQPDIEKVEKVFFAESVGAI